MTLRVQLGHTIRMDSTVVVVSEIFAPTGPQIWELVRGDHRHCSMLNLERCIELCTIPLRPDDVPNVTPAVTDYEILDVRIPDLVDYAENSVIFRQTDKQQFTLARLKKICSPRR